MGRLEWAAHLEREVAAANRDPERFQWLMLRENPTWEPEDGAQAVAALRACEIEVVAESERQGMGYRTAELVERVEVPSLLLMAEEARSALVGEARQRVLAAVPPTMTVTVFHSGHVIHRDAFDDYVRTVVDWASPGLT